MANEKKMNYVILGLLSHESMTGYEMKKRIDSSLKFFWGASYGSIYPTLDMLVRERMVTKYETRENGRDKVIYTITDSGREHLRKWLYLPVEKDELRYETLLKLFFGSEIGGDDTAKHIINFRNRINGEMPILKQVVKELSKLTDTGEAHRYYMLAAMFGVKVYEAYLEWCEEAEQILSKKEN